MAAAPARRSGPAHLVLETMADPRQRRAEWVERKGLGHPDTLSDAIAEAISRALCRVYLQRFGRILHHNVDKVLVVGGAARPRFGGGEVVEPIRIVTAGRATTRVGNDTIDLQALVREAGEDLLRRSVRMLDPARHVVWDCRIRPGAANLQGLLTRGTSDAPLANDSSAGAGFAPLSPLERIVLATERLLTEPATRPHAACGEDVKVAGVRRDDTIELTVACAAIGGHVADAAAYRAFRTATVGAVETLARADLGDAVAVALNAADDPATDDCYLTVTGTSAENGDDGETGRGNRANGLIAVGRPMSMEATAGKNPVNHVGKLYSVVAQELAEDAVRSVAGVTACDCVVAGRIGSPITVPHLAHVRVALAPGAGLPDVEPALRARVDAAMAGVAGLWRRIVAGAVRLF